MTHKAQQSFRINTFKYFWFNLEQKTRLSRHGTPMLKIRRLRERLIINMEITIMVRRHFYIETMTMTALGFQWYTSGSRTRLGVSWLIVYHNIIGVILNTLRCHNIVLWRGQPWFLLPCRTISHESTSIYIYIYIYILNISICSTILT